MENQLVTILRITKPQVGSFVKRRLESEGIECFFTNEGLKMGGTYNPDEVLLKVKAGSSERAIKLLMDMHKEYDLDTLAEDTSYAQMKKILLPVKMSDDCLELCEFAISVAQKNNAEIKLLYVYEDPIIHESAKHTVSWEKHVKMELQEAHKKAQLKLVNFSLEIKKLVSLEVLKSVNLHYRMLKGIPEHVIVDAAERYDPDIIIMGSKGKYKKETEFHRKTISKVIERSNFPVLVVPPKAVFEGKEKINVLYATDFNESDNLSLNKLLAILQAFDKQIFCVHIDLHDDSRHQDKVDELNKILARDYAVHNIECVLFKSDDVVKGLETFSDENDIDIISFSKMKRSTFYKMFRTSFIEKIVSVENIPMLIFPV